MSYKPSQNMLRVALIVAIMLLQLAILIVIISLFSNWSPIVYAINFTISILVGVYLVNSNTQINYKFSWILAISIMPIFGGIFFVLYGLHPRSRGTTKVFRDMHQISDEVFLENKDIDRAVPATADAAKQAHFLEQTTGYPVYLNTATTYLPTGEEQFDVMLEAIRQAQRFIFLEYFIISDGQMWQSLFELLKIKVQEGVEVKLLYDDVGSFRLLPAQFKDKLEETGIEVIAYNPLKAVFSLRYNNRDHRKMMIVDGYIAMTGGINIADEYINKKLRFGHWKDTGLVLAGPAVWNFTVMFLSVWNTLSENPVDLFSYAPHRWAVDTDRLANSHGGDVLRELLTGPRTGHVLPFDDSPYDGEHQAAAAYRNIINRATQTIDICTPYLVLDDELLNSITGAAQSGIRVRIITPHIPDKPYVHATTRSYYRHLLEKGVQIFEYTPGFIHAKSIVSDNSTAIIGTVNFDYRSLYLHMENAVWLYGCESIHQMTEDFEDTLKLSHEIHLEDELNIRAHTKLLRSLLRVFAPLM